MKDAFQKLAFIAFELMPVFQDSKIITGTIWCKDRIRNGDGSFS